MLVLSRKIEELIEFPELGISIEVLRIKGNSVRLGIKAHESVRILRGELLEMMNELQDHDPATVSAPAMPQQFDCQVA